MARVSQSKLLRDVIFLIYDGLSTEYKENVEFNTFYEVEMTNLINEYKQKI